MMRYGGNTSCVEVRSGEELLILDAGTGIRQLGDDLLKQGGDRPINATLLISHTHWDHIQGLPFFAPAYSAQNCIRLFAAHAHGAMLEHALRNQMSPMHFPVDLDKMAGLLGVRELSPDVTQIGNFSIRTEPLNHPGGCSAFRIEAGGAVVAYLPDHEPYRSGDGVRRDALLEFIRGAELLILDTQYTAAEYPSRMGWGHGCLPDSVALAVEAGVSRLALFHHDPSHADNQIDEMVNSARQMSAPSQLTVQGAMENEVISLRQQEFKVTPSVSPTTFAKTAAA
jgi:phosphoribosyl 1,2-cyclic phosphodiesterase